MQAYSFYVLTINIAPVRPPWRNRREKVRPQLMPRDTSRPFDLDSPLCWNPLAPPDPVGDGRLPDAKLTRQGELAAGSLNGPLKCFKSDHEPPYITLGNYKSSTQSDKDPPQTRAMPKRAETGEMWERFLAAVRDLAHPKSVDQSDIGRAVGVNQSMVSEYKRGKKKPAMDSALRLAAYAEMCVEYLLTAKGPQRPWGTVDADFQKLVQHWEALDDDRRAELLKHAALLHEAQGRTRKPKHGKLPNIEDTLTMKRRRSPH